MSEAENDALTQKLRSVLSSPDSMAKIQAIAGSLGASDLPFPLPEPAAEASAAPASEASAAPSLPSGMDVSLITRLAPLLGNMGKDNQDTRLLRALRPYLHGEREKRLDEAIHLVQLAPLLQQLGGKENT